MRTSLVDRRSAERLLLLVGALRSGLIDALEGEEARSLEEVAQAAGTDVRASRVVLAALVSEGIVEEFARPGAGVSSGAGAPSGGAPVDAGAPSAAVSPPVGVTPPGASILYRLSPLGRAHLVDEGPDLERAGLIHEANKLRGWLDLPEVLRTGRPATSGMARQNVRSRALAMGERDPAVLHEVVERCLAYGGPIRTMLDVGGSVGHLAREFARRGVKTSLFDQEEVLPIAREFLGREFSSEECCGGETGTAGSAAGAITLLAGDFTVALPPGPFDLVYFGNVLHIYGPETNARAARDAYGITVPGGTVAIQDYVWGRGPDAALFAVNMLRSTVDGGVWTEDQHREWLSGAGFVDIEVLDLDTSGAQLVFGRRPRGS